MVDARMGWLLAGVLWGSASAQAAQPCWLRGIEHEAQCGHVVRALDPARPNGPRIEVHYAVLPALARNKKPDPLFFFAGGPGQSAIDLAPQIGALLGRFSNRRDIVLVDARGVGRSAPLACDDDDDPARPLAEQFDLQRQREAIAHCLERLRALPHGDLRFYTTTLAMADVDAVRAALGAERINIVGASYGTRAALEYQRQFPQRVRRAVLDGVAPADMVLPAASSLDNQAALDALFDACERARPFRSAHEPERAAQSLPDERDTAGCAAREPALRVRWRALLASLPREASLAHPLTGRVERVALTRDLLLGMVRGPLYAPSLGAALPAAIGAATRDRFEPLAALASALGMGRRNGRSPPVAMGMHLAVICSEDVPRMPADGATGADFGRAFEDFYRDLCARVPRADVAPAFFTLPPAPAATLLLSGGLDPATPPRHAERVAKALGAHARHVVVANAGHGVMGIGCMRDVLYRFVEAETDAQALQVDAACVTAIPRPPMFVAPGDAR